MTRSFPDDVVLRYSVLRLTNCLSRKRPVRTMPIPGLAAAPAQRLLLETGKLRLDVAKQHRATVGIRQRVERVRRRVERAMRAADIEHARGVSGFRQQAVDVAAQLHALLCSRSGANSAMNLNKTVISGPQRWIAGCPSAVLRGRAGEPVALIQTISLWP